MSDGIIFSSDNIILNISNCGFSGLYSGASNDFPLVFYTRGLYNIFVGIENCNFTNLTRMLILIILLVFRC
jgi:hypothetical protein